MTTTAETLAAEVVELAVNGGWTDEQLPYVQWLAPRVEAGAAFMDAVLPDWPTVILGQELEMQNAYGCVLGHTAVAIADRLTGSCRDQLLDPHGEGNFHTVHGAFANLFATRDEDGDTILNTAAADHITQALGFTILANGPDPAPDFDCTDGHEASLAWGVLGDLWLIQARRRCRLTAHEIDELQRRRDELVAALADNQAELAEIEGQLRAAGLVLA